MVYFQYLHKKICDFDDIMRTRLTKSAQLCFRKILQKKPAELWTSVNLELQIKIQKKNCSEVEDHIWIKICENQDDLRHWVPEVVEPYRKSLINDSYRLGILKKGLAWIGNNGIEIHNPYRILLNFWARTRKRQDKQDSKIDSLNGSW